MSQVTPVFENIPSGTVHRTIGLLHGALTRLNAGLDNGAIEKIGVMVHRAMSTQQRSFHTPEHIFDLSKPEEAHTTLAAIFHDIVYFQVDNGFLEEIETLLQPYVTVENGQVRIRESIDPGNRAYQGCAAVFGMQPGQVLSPFGGLNEFLSALVMDLLLVDTVSDVDLLIATACIEATIPFRGPDKEGRKPAEKLAERLSETNRTFGLGLSDKAIRDAVVAAVNFANRDVSNFADENVGTFLDNTWKLLPETNPALRTSGVYTIRNYGIALSKMEGFLSNLSPGSIFHQFDSSPPPQIYEELIERATVNLRTAQRYLGIKIISAAILQAFADSSGGDAPVAFFMGDIDPKDPESKLSAHLPTNQAGCVRSAADGDALHNLLEHGRASSSHFDLQNSPLSLFVHRCLSDADELQAIAAAREYIGNSRSVDEFLESLPRPLIAAVARAAAHMAFTRREALLQIAARFEV